MLSPFFINESYTDQLFNQNAVSLLNARIQPGRIGFGNGIIKTQNSCFQIRRLISFTYQCQNNLFAQLSLSKQFSRLTMFGKDEKSEDSYFFAGMRFFPNNSFSSFIGHTQKKDNNVKKQYIDISLFKNYSLTYFYDMLVTSQNLQSHTSLRIQLPNYKNSFIRHRRQLNERFCLNLVFDQHPQVELSTAIPLSLSNYFSGLMNYDIFDKQFKLLTQITCHYQGYITKLGIEAQKGQNRSITPYILLEMVLFEDPNIMIKVQYEKNKPSAQINFDYDSSKDR